MNQLLNFAIQPWHLVVFAVAGFLLLCNRQNVEALLRVVSP